LKKGKRGKSVGVLEGRLICPPWGERPDLRKKDFEEEEKGKIYSSVCGKNFHGQGRAREPKLRG